MADVTVQTSVARCPVCKCTRPVWRFKLNHSAHLILSILTGGFWSIVWLTRAGYNRWGIGWRCAFCNTKIKDRDVL